MKGKSFCHLPYSLDFFCSKDSIAVIENAPRKREFVLYISSCIIDAPSKPTATGPLKEKWISLQERRYVVAKNWNHFAAVEERRSESFLFAEKKTEKGGGNRQVM